MNIDQDYMRCFKEIVDIRGRSPEIRLSSPLDVPRIIVRNWLRRKYSAQFLSKIGVILVAVCRVTSSIPPIIRIYLWGPECFGEWEAIHESGYFTHLGIDWPNGNGETLGSGDISASTQRLNELMEYPEVNEVQRICSYASRLSPEQLLRLSYDVALNRKKPTGSVKIAPEESFADLVKNTFCSAFLKGLPLGLFQHSLTELPKGNVQINHMENPLEGSSEPYVDCLKVGPSNNLLTYHAICFLNVIGFRATVASLSMLLSTHLLRVTVDIRRIVQEYFRTRSEFHQCKRYYEIGEYEKLTAEQLYALNKLHRLETKRKSLAVAIKNTAKSVKSLTQEGAIRRIGREFIANGNIIQTPKGATEFDPKALQEYYWTRMREMHQIHQLTLQLRGKQSRLSGTDQNRVEAGGLASKRFIEDETHREGFNAGIGPILPDAAELLLLKIDRLQTFMEGFRAEDKESHGAILRQSEEIRDLCIRYAESWPQKVSQILDSEIQELQEILLEIVETARDRNPEVSQEAREWHGKLVVGLGIAADIVQLVSFISGIPSLPALLGSQTAERATRFIGKVISRLKGIT